MKKTKRVIPIDRWMAGTILLAMLSLGLHSGCTASDTFLSALAESMSTALDESLADLLESLSTSTSE